VCVGGGGYLHGSSVCVGGGLISFFLNGLFLEGKSISLLKCLLLFRCVFEARFKVQS
jgi:hypothetical protein